MANEKIGSWAFIIGVLIAVIFGLAGSVFVGLEAYAILALVILGLIVGFLNITDKEIKTFLIASIALLLVGSATLLPLNTLIPGLNLGTYLQSIVNNIAVFVAPAALITALKAVYMIGKAPEPSKF